MILIKAGNITVNSSLRKRFFDAKTHVKASEPNLKFNEATPPLPYVLFLMSCEMVSFNISPLLAQNPF